VQVDSSATSLDTAMGRRNETALPLPLVDGSGNTGAWADIADTDISEIDLPAVGTMRITAAGQFDHGVDGWRIGALKVSLSRTRATKSLIKARA
jgi:hypothetical protein